MRLFDTVLGLFGLLITVNTLAAEPLAELRNMIESDMAGVPMARIALSTPKTTVAVSRNRQIERHRVAFELDSDALEIADAWRIEENSRNCNSAECEVLVTFQVVATTTGKGIPSWDRPAGREIRVLNHAGEKTERYKLTKVQDRWVINRLSLPYVSPAVMENFFRREIELTEHVSTHSVTDPRALKNQNIVKAWRLRQLEELRKLTFEVK
jgi:hypothetical protein